MLIHMDGFDEYATGTDLSFQYGYVGMNIGTTSGRFGQGGVVSPAGHYYYIQKLFNINYTDVWTGCALIVSDLGGYYPNDNCPGVTVAGDKTVMVFTSNGGYYGDDFGNIEMFITYNALLGTWRAIRDQQVTNLVPTLIATGSYNVGQRNWHWLDVHYIPSLASGTIELYVDGNQVISISGVQTSCWQNNINSIYLGCPNLQGIYNYTSATLGGTYDDWYILDATTGSYNINKIGDSRIFTLVPNRDAGPNDGVPSSGTNHYTMVDEPQNDGLTTYITIQGVSGQEELFGTTTLPTEPTNIWATRVLNIVEQTAGGVIAANAIVVSHSVEAQGPSQPLLSVFFNQYGIFETDPATGVPWTYSNVNIAEVGIVIA